jgi:hypothetical protein
MNSQGDKDGGQKINNQKPTNLFSFQKHGSTPTLPTRRFPQPLYQLNMNRGQTESKTNRNEETSNSTTKSIHFTKESGNESPKHQLQDEPLTAGIPFKKPISIQKTHSQAKRNEKEPDFSPKLRGDRIQSRDVFNHTSKKTRILHSFENEMDNENEVEEVSFVEIHKPNSSSSIVSDTLSDTYSTCSTQPIIHRDVLASNRERSRKYTSNSNDGITSILKSQYNLLVEVKSKIKQLMVWQSDVDVTRI